MSRHSVLLSLFFLSRNCCVLLIFSLSSTCSTSFSSSIPAWNKVAHFIVAYMLCLVTCAFFDAHSGILSFCDELLLTRHLASCLIRGAVDALTHLTVRRQTRCSTTCVLQWTCSCCQLKAHQSAPLCANAINFDTAQSPVPLRDDLV